MIDNNPCQGCEFFNKPYWSVVSPCKNCPKVYTGGYVTTTTTAIPSVEYAPVVHAKWLLDGRCSNCLENPLTTHKTYCPNCGARMDLEE